ncbi:MAG: aspartyl protease family protein [Acidobacteriota bacterium]|nr:aspartyl protease family protein [Acidobacteriota bacterium]
MLTLLGRSSRSLVCSLALLTISSAPAQSQVKGNATRGAQAVASHHRFTQGRAALRIPFELGHNLIFVRARVNGSGPLWFILDTGASASLLSESVAKELGLREGRRERGTGTGGPIEVGMIDGVTFALPGVEVTGQTVGAFPMDEFGFVAGRRVGGVLGYDFIKEFVVELDYAARSLNLYEPAGYGYEGAGEIVPVNFFNHKPHTRATVVLDDRQSFDGTFEIDTGGDGVLVASTAFVKAHKLDELIPNRRATNSGGAGGTVGASEGRVAAVRVGRFALNRPIVTLIQARAGEHATERFDGVIGGEFFRRFKLILDYSRSRVVLEPNAHLGDPVEADMSGLEFAADGPDFKQFVVNEVAPGSPAADAGFKEEDVLVSIDDRPSSALTLEEIRALLQQEGAERTLTIRRGGETLKFRIKLRRLL